MKIGVQGGQEIEYSYKDRNLEVIVVSVSYIFPNSKLGAIYDLKPKPLHSVKHGELLAIKVNRERLLRGRTYFFVGQDVFKLKKTVLIDGTNAKTNIDVTTKSKYKTINRFLFKGVKPSENIPKQLRVHRDKGQIRIKNNRKVSNIQNKGVRRKRRNSKAV